MRVRVTFWDTCRRQHCRLPAIVLLVAAGGICKAAERPSFNIETPVTHALGGYHSAYEGGLLCLFNNPAALEISQYRGLFQLALGATGTIDEDLALINTIIGGQRIGGDMVTTYGAKNLGYTPPEFYLNGPFAAGYVAKGFGMAIFNRLFYDSALYNNQWTVNLNVDVTGAIGVSATLFETYNHKMHIGASVKPSARYMLNVLSQNVVIDADAAKQRAAAGRGDRITFNLATNAGILYTLRDTFLIGINCDDLLTPSMFLYLEPDPLDEPFFTFAYQKLNAGISLRPLQSGALYWNIMVDFRDILNATRIVGPLPKEILMYLSAGMELVIKNAFAVRIGFADLRPSAGLGYDFGSFALDASFYFKQYGLKNDVYASYAFDLGFTLK